MDDPPYYGCGPWSDTKVTEFIPYPDSDYEDEDTVTTPPHDPPRLIRTNQSQFYNFVIYLNNNESEASEEEMRNARIRSINRLFQEYNEYRHTRLRLDGNPDSDTEEEVIEDSRYTDDEISPLESP